MQKIKEQLNELFIELNNRIDEINIARRNDGLPPIANAKVQILGQMSLLSNDMASMILSLAQTGDLVALLTMDHVIKEELKKALAKQGLVYDEDSYLIWIPPGAKFVPVKPSVRFDPAAAVDRGRVQRPLDRRRRLSHDSSRARGLG